MFKTSQSSVFHQAVLSPMTKPVPVIVSAVSLVSYFRNSKIQLGGARLLSALFMADFSESYTYSNTSLGLDDKQIAHFRNSISRILSQKPPRYDDLIVATLKLLTWAASGQPAFLAALIAVECSNTQLHDAHKHHPKETEKEALETAAMKAEEVGFVDVADFPELPMPDILHGLQDQGITIVTELCEANKMKQVVPEIQEVCLLLLQVIVTASYLEYSVLQICGIRPVLGRVETFSKELRLLIRATEGQVFLKEQLTNLKQIVAFVYPELVHQDALF